MGGDARARDGGGWGGRWRCAASRTERGDGRRWASCTGEVLGDEARGSGHIFLRLGLGRETYVGEPASRCMGEVGFARSQGHGGDRVSVVGPASGHAADPRHGRAPARRDGVVSGVASAIRFAWVGSRRPVGLTFGRSATAAGHLTPHDGCSMCHLYSGRAEVSEVSAPVGGRVGSWSTDGILSVGGQSAPRIGLGDRVGGQRAGGEEIAFASPTRRLGLRAAQGSVGGAEGVQVLESQAVEAGQVSGSHWIAQRCRDHGPAAGHRMGPIIRGPQRVRSRLLRGRPRWHLQWGVGEGRGTGGQVACSRRDPQGHRSRRGERGGGGRRGVAGIWVVQSMLQAHPDLRSSASPTTAAWAGEAFMQTSPPGGISV